jgi:hypothetical protein
MIKHCFKPNMKKLEELVSLGAIKSFVFTDLDADGKPSDKSALIGRPSDICNERNTQQLVLEFSDGNKLTIDTFCSGCYENTELILS